MAILESLLIGSAIVQGIGSVVSGIGSNRAAAAASREGRRLYRDRIAMGEEEVNLYEMDLSRLLGAQRTILAAGQGLDTEQGSAKQLRDQTVAFGEEDVGTIRENAMREALGLRRQARNQAQGYRAQAVGQFAQGAGTLLTAGANQWDIYSRRRGVRRAVGNTIGRDIAAWG
jgi:hypothetical protein